MQYQRLLLLLDALSSTSSKARPKGVGMKTLIEARDNGLVEVIGDIRRVECVLTDDGRALHRKIRDRLPWQGELASMSSSSTETVGGGD